MTALAPFDGSYAVKVFDSNAAELGAGTLALSGSTLQFTPATGLSGSTAASATVSAVCENTDASGKAIGAVAVIDAQRHIDFFAPAFSGLTISGSDLGSASNSGRYQQATLPKNTPAPTPAAVGWSSVSASGAGMTGARLIEPNTLPDLGYQNSSSGLTAKISWNKVYDPSRGDSAQDIVSVQYRLDTGAVVGVALALVRDPMSTASGGAYAATCTSCSGVTVDLGNGEVRFDNTALQATVLSNGKDASSLTGSLKLPNYRPRTGTQRSAAEVAACSVPAKSLGAPFSDIACLAGQWVGTGMTGQSCSLKIDAATSSFAFDDGSIQRSFSYAEVGGYPTLSTFASTLTRSTTLKNANDPLESIAIQLSPDATVSSKTKVLITAMKSIGGTVNNVYHRTCRLDFDTANP